MRTGGNGTVPQEFLTFDPSLLLKSFAIECLLKAKYLKDIGSLANDGKLNNLSGHNLLSWCNRIQMEVTNDERVVLKTLSLIATSYGRYPVPKKYQHNPLQRTKNGYKPRYTWSDDDMKIVDTFIEKISNGS